MSIRIASLICLDAGGWTLEGLIGTYIFTVYKMYCKQDFVFQNL